MDLNWKFMDLTCNFKDFDWKIMDFNCNFTDFQGHFIDFNLNLIDWHGHCIHLNWNVKGFLGFSWMFIDISLLFIYLYLSLSHFSKQLSIVKYWQLEKCNVRHLGQMCIGRAGGGRKSYHTIFRFAFSLDKCARPFWWMRLSILANASVHFGEYCILCYIFTFVVMFLWFILCVLKTVLFTVVLNILMLMLIFFFSIALGSLPSPACITHERFHSLTTFLTATGLLLHHVGNVLGSILYEIVI